MNATLEHFQHLGLSWVHGIETYPSLPSTNAFARTRIAAGCVPGTVIRARQQTAGRGRQGRHWLGHKGSLTFSTVWPLQWRIPEALPLVIGVGAAAALARWVPDIRVKWPNDLWVGDRKVAGMLGETFLATDERWLIFGMGINVNGHFPLQEEGNQAASLAECCGTELPLETVFLHVLQHMDSILTQYAAGQGSLQKDLERWGNFLHRLVEVRGSHERFCGRAVGVRGDGALLVETGQRITAVHAGDVSLRPATSP